MKKKFILNLKEELKHEDFIEKIISIPFDSLDLPKEYSNGSKDVEVHLYIIKEKEGYVVSLNINSDIKVECSRCLEPFNMDLTGSNSILFSKKLGKNKELKEKDLYTEYLKDEEHFDINELVREEIIVQTPMKPLCDENCKGICPVCGGNKNENLCNCESKSMKKDSPFSKLQVLLEKKKATK